MPDGRVKDAALETLLKTHHSDGARVIVFCLYAIASFHNFFL